jgi:phospholipase/carboxylesterase
MANPRLITTKLGPLVARVVEFEGAAPTLACVLCHGYGAPGTDLVGIAGEILLSGGGQAPALREKVRFVFPEAPLQVPFAGRAWWNIDISRYERAMSTGDIEPLFDDVPDGMPQARKMVMALVEELAKSFPMSRIVLGGFSQGAMITTDVALRLEEAPAGLAIFSGTLLCRPEWTKLATKRAGLDVVMTHGTHDPLLPYAAAMQLKALLESSGLKIRFHEFAGGHGLDGECIDLLARLLLEKTANP